MEKSELEKAKAYLSKRKNTYKELSKRSGLSVEMLKKFSEDTQRLERSYYRNVRKLAELYDKEIMGNQLEGISPKKISKFHQWLENEIPNDTLGINLKKEILENQSLYLELLSKVDEGDGKNGR